MGDKIAGALLWQQRINTEILENDLLRFFQQYIKFFNWKANPDLLFVHDVDEIFQ